MNVIDSGMKHDRLCNEHDHSGIGAVLDVGGPKKRIVAN